MNKLFAQLKSSDQLPTPPTVAMRVLEVVRSDDVDISDLAEVISCDPALAARIIRHCNSPAVGMSRTISSLQQAIALLGIRTVKTLALSFSLVSTEFKSCPSFDYDLFWAQALSVAVAGRCLCRPLGQWDPEEAFLAGLMSSIGQLALASGLPAEYEEVIRVSKQNSMPLNEAEYVVFGDNHVSISCELLKDWRFPSRLILAISESAELGTFDEAVRPEAAIIDAARRISEVICEESPSLESLNEVLEIASTRFGIEEDAWEDLFLDITEQWQEYGALLRIPTEQVRPFHDIEAEAQSHLAMITNASNSQQVPE